MREPFPLFRRTRAGALVMFCCLEFASSPRGLAQTPAPAASAPVPVPNIDAWLAANPNVEKTIVCQWETGPFEYSKWTPPEKKRLQQTFAKVWKGEPSGLPDPLANALPTVETEPVKQGLAEHDALALYLQTIANSLVVEIRHEVPWSILSYKPDELAVLFDSREMFTRIPPAAGQPPDSAIYEIKRIRSGSCLPAAPEVSIGFLRRQNLVAGNPRDTVSATLDWCKGLTHFSGNYETANMQKHWLYTGFPPESRIISGTVFQNAPSPGGKVEHFTAGCWGTTGFLRAVLRSVNIPVEQSIEGGHSLPHFPTLDAYMTHGDDPYNLLFRTMQPPLKAAELLIDSNQFATLFPPKDLKAAAEKVGDRPRELAVKHIPLQLLWNYADDLKQHKPHNEGRVFQELKGSFTLEQLEADGLWIRLDARMNDLGGAEKIARLRTELLEKTNNHLPDP